MIIVGAGLSGLIAGSMLRDQVTSIWECQTGIPNNHSALLRFRSSVVGDAVGVPFKKVEVMKAIIPTFNPVGDAIAYALKCTGKAQLRSIATTSDGVIEERYVAPDNLIPRLAEQLSGKVEFGMSLKPVTFEGERDRQFISTIPMPVLMDILDYPDRPSFPYIQGQVLTCDLRDTEIYATLYYPNPDFIPYRASITGSRLMVEIAHPVDPPATIIPDKVAGMVFQRVLRDFGLYTMKRFREVVGSYQVKMMPYAKIGPIEEAARKRFILWATDNFNVYSLGRFATWRPGLLLDDIVKDIRTIQRIASGDPEPRYRSQKR